MIKSKEYVPSENVKLLSEIYKLKNILSELNAQNGPNTSEYISLSFKLQYLEKKYIDEKINLFTDSIFSYLETKNSKNRQVIHYEVNQKKASCGD